MKKKPQLDLSEIRALMRTNFREIMRATGQDDTDDAQEHNVVRILSNTTNNITNELVLLCWNAVSAADADSITPDNFDAGVLLTGPCAEPEVAGALILGMCDRLFNLGVEVGAFTDIREPLELLAATYLHNNDESGCGHA